MKDEFIKLFTENIHRDGADKLLEWILKTDFFTAPASTKYHSCHEGGLCEHSVNVFNRFKLNVSDYCEHDAEYMEKHSELIAVCALLHDLCKANFYTVSMRNVKNESGQWEKQPYYSVEEKFPFGHGEKSVFLIERYMKLTPEEAVAIRFHMGEFEKDRSTSDAYAKFPLALMLHIADLEATYLDERTA
jgi:hypothetical protein